MKRVLILGCSGAGKSTLALTLGERWRLPVIHLDKHYWRAGWVEPPREEWRAQVAELTARPEWIMDGNYGGTLPERLAVADMAIVFDFPTWRCLLRAFRRAVVGYGRTRPDLADGCPEHIDFKFLLYILNFRRKNRPSLMQALDSFAGPKLTFTGPAEVARWLSTPAPQLPHGAPPS
ncbi:MAG: adenylate kinase [Alphaproteobacteria bacterium]|nr:adenylate kinase [Alphaproteobacteria bacterium]